MLRLIIISLYSYATSFGAVVSNTNISLASGSGLFFPYDYQLTIQQFSVSFDPTSIFFNRQGENLVFLGMNLDEGSDWYFADLNDVFRASTISQGLFPTFNSVGQSYAVGYTDFYLAVNTSPGFSFQNPEDSRTIFGWALLRNSIGGLQLLESGVSYDAPGIIVGTTMVPEVSSTTMFGVSALAILFARRLTK